MRRVLPAIVFVALLGPYPVPVGLAQTTLASVSESADLEAAQSIVGTPDGRKLEGQLLASETLRVAALLRCPVCQGLSVADSPAQMAVNMRHQVRDLLAAGFSEAQILRYFESAYGEFVRLEPPLRGINWSLWLAPLIGLLAGGLVVWWLLRPARRLREPSGPATPGGAAGAERDEAPASLTPAQDGEVIRDDPELVPYLRRVRELAYGWPGGVPPTEGDRQ
jgi:cytochrome c-type biogenesis protein CcmH